MMYEIVMTGCLFVNGMGRTELICKDRVLTYHEGRIDCETTLRTVRTDGRNVVVYCRPRPTKVERK